MHGRTTLIAGALLLALTLGACTSRGTMNDAGGNPTGPTGASAATGVTPAAFPVTVTGTNGELTIEERPERIVSLSPTATEDLFAIGAGEQVIAVDDQSTYPSEAPMTDLSGYQPNVEAIAGYSPDLVVYSTEIGDLGMSLERLGIPALQLDAAVTLDDVYEQLETLGAATGNAEPANALTEQMRAEVQHILAGVDTSRTLTYYYELDDTFYSVTSSTFIGQVLALLGLENIADEARRASSGYPQLSAEYIIEADPDLILLADTKCCGQDASTIAERPGWSRLSAVREGNVVELDDDVASRWGPRVVDLMREVAEARAEAA
jgi:iron complex transport system substrate-binding protein